MKLDAARATCKPSGTSTKAAKIKIATAQGVCHGDGRLQQMAASHTATPKTALNSGETRTRHKRMAESSGIRRMNRKQARYLTGRCSHGIGMVGVLAWRSRRLSLGRSLNHVIKRVSCLTASS